jgi:hypothetical protein
LVPLAEKKFGSLLQNRDISLSALVFFVGLRGTARAAVRSIYHSRFGSSSNALARHIHLPLLLHGSGAFHPGRDYGLLPVIGREGRAVPAHEPGRRDYRDVGSADFQLSRHADGRLIARFPGLWRDHELAIFRDDTRRENLRADCRISAALSQRAQEGDDV